MAAAGVQEKVSDFHRLSDRVLAGNPADDFARMEKAKRNQAYLEMLDRSFAQAKAGKLQYHDLIEVDE